MIEEIVKRLDGDYNYYQMVPNMAANVIMTVCFGLLFVLHFGLGVWTRQWWFFVAFICGTALETIGYVGRAISHHDPYDLNPYLMQSTCITLAPCFLMGGVYNLLSKFIMIYGREYAVMKPMKYSYLFIACDIISLCVQGAGGGLAATEASSTTSVGSNLGVHVVIAGLIFQVVSMAVFICLFLHFFWRLRTRSVSVDDLEPLNSSPVGKVRNPKLFKLYPWVVFIVVVLVFVRCIYRVFELGAGHISDYLQAHEIYIMLLDALLIVISCALLVPFHPGLVFGNVSRIVKGHNSSNGNASLKESAYEEEYGVVDVENKRFWNKW